MDIPSAEDFLEASRLSTLYEYGYKEHILPLVTDFVENFYTADIEKFIETHEQIRLTLLNDLLVANPRIEKVLEWFNDQPATVSVLGDIKSFFLKSRNYVLINWLCSSLLFYYAVETEPLPDELEEIKRFLKKEDSEATYHFEVKQHQYIKQLLRSKKHDFTLQTLNDLQDKFKQKNINLKEKVSFRNIEFSFAYEKILERLGSFPAANFIFVRFISALARMANWYIAETYIERVTVSKDRLDKIINLLSSLRIEVELMQASKWCPGNLEKIALPYKDKTYRKYGVGAVERLIKIQKEELLIAKRKDQTVQERLMIVDLIRSYKKSYNQFMDKREIFKLMELPFIKNLVEMKTIERIIATEKANQEKIQAKKKRSQEEKKQRRKEAEKSRTVR